MRHMPGEYCKFVQWCSVSYLFICCPALQNRGGSYVLHATMNTRTNCCIVLASCIRTWRYHDRTDTDRMRRAVHGRMHEREAGSGVSTDLCMGGCGQKHENEKINKNEYGNGNARERMNRPV